MALTDAALASLMFCSIPEVTSDVISDKIERQVVLDNATKILGSLVASVPNSSEMQYIPNNELRGLLYQALRISFA